MRTAEVRTFECDYDGITDHDHLKANAVQRFWIFQHLTCKKKPTRADCEVN